MVPLENPKLPSSPLWTGRNWVLPFSADPRYNRWRFVRARSDTTSRSTLSNTWVSLGGTYLSVRRNRHAGRIPPCNPWSTTWNWPVRGRCTAFPFPSSPFWTHGIWNLPRKRYLGTLRRLIWIDRVRARTWRLPRYSCATILDRWDSPDWWQLTHGDNRFYSPQHTISYKMKKKINKNKYAYLLLIFQ